MSPLPLEPEWRPVPEWEDLFEVSSDGRVRSLVARTCWPAKRELQQTSPSEYGHLRVALARDGVTRRVFVHRLVAAAFIGPRPEGQFVRHLNGISTDNRPENLAYGTASDNAQDSLRHGTHFLAARTSCAAGHAYDAKNTRYTPGRPDKRVCRTCSNEASRRYKIRKAAAQAAANDADAAA